MQRLNPLHPLDMFIAVLTNMLQEQLVLFYVPGFIVVTAVTAVLLLYTPTNCIEFMVTHYTISHPLFNE